MLCWMMTGQVRSSGGNGSPSRRVGTKFCQASLYIMIKITSNTSIIDIIRQRKEAAKLMSHCPPGLYP